MMSVLRGLWCSMMHGFYIEEMSGDWMLVGCRKCKRAWWRPR